MLALVRVEIAAEEPAGVAGDSQAVDAAVADEAVEDVRGATTQATERAEPKDQSGGNDPDFKKLGPTTPLPGGDGAVARLQLLNLTKDEALGDYRWDAL